MTPQAHAARICIFCSVSSRTYLLNREQLTKTGLSWAHNSPPDRAVNLEAPREPWLGCTSGSLAQITVTLTVGLLSLHFLQHRQGPAAGQVLSRQWARTILWPLVLLEWLSMIVIIDVTTDL